MGDRVEIKLCWLAHGEGLKAPHFQTEGAAGADLAAAVELDLPLVLQPGARAMVPCGFGIALPVGYEAQIRPRSGLAAKHGVTVLNSPGTVDCDYRGEIKVILINHGQVAFSIARGDRIAQIVIAKTSSAAFEIVEVLDDTERGTQGFGSTGVE